MIVRISQKSNSATLYVRRGDKWNWASRLDFNMDAGTNWFQLVNLETRPSQLGKGYASYLQYLVLLYAFSFRIFDVVRITYLNAKPETSENDKDEYFTDRLKTDDNINPVTINPDTQDGAVLMNLLNFPALRKNLVEKYHLEKPVSREDLNNNYNPPIIKNEEIRQFVSDGVLSKYYFKLGLETFRKYSSLVYNNVTKKENNSLRKKANDAWVTGKPQALSDSENKQYVLDLTHLTDAERQRLIDKGKKNLVIFAFSAGGLATRSNGKYTAAYEFNDIKFPAAFRDKTYTRVKLDSAGYGSIYIHASLGLNFIVKALAKEGLNIDLNATKDEIREKGYARLDYDGKDIYLFSSEAQLRIVPGEETLEQYYSQKVGEKQKLLDSGDIKKEEFERYKTALRKGIEWEKGKKGQVLRKSDGRPVTNPAGHWDFLRMIAISGLLNKTKNEGFDFIIHSDLNNPVAHSEDLYLGAFREIIENARKENLPVPVMMWLLCDNLNERGGFIARVKYNNGEERVQLVEGRAMTDADEEFINARPYYNIGTFYIYVDGLLKMFGLDQEGVSYNIDERIKKVEHITNQLNVYMDIKEEPDGEMILPGVQLERIYGDISGVAKSCFALVNRKENLQSIKTDAEANDNARMQTIAEIIYEGFAEVSRATLNAIVKENLQSIKTDAEANDNARMQTIAEIIYEGFAEVSRATLNAIVSLIEKIELEVDVFKSKYGGALSQAGEALLIRLNDLKTILVKYKVSKEELGEALINALAAVRIFEVSETGLSMVVKFNKNYIFNDGLACKFIEVTQ